MRTVLLVAAVFVAAGGGYALGAAVGGDDAPTVKRYVVPGSTDDDPTVDKWVTAECPEGTTVVSGGAVVPHGNDTPGVAVYWSARTRTTATRAGGRRRRTRAAARAGGCSRSRRSA